METDSEKEYRAILTEWEREILSGEADVSNSYYYRVVSRVREKIGLLERDLKTLDENHAELANELRQAVCSEENNE